jgi:hypothetical protein
MDRSAYLAQLLQASPQAQQGPSAPGMDLAAMAGAAQQRKAWEAANPGGNYFGRNLAQAGRNVMAAPGNVMANIQALPGLFSLGRKGAP